MDERILARRAQHSPTDQEQEGPTDQEQEGNEGRKCFYCLEGWVFLGSLDHDGEEVTEVNRCRKCGGIGRIGIG